MQKRIFSVILAIIMLFCITLPAFAFTPTGFEVHAEAGILMSYDTGEVIYEKNSTLKRNTASLVMLMSSLVIAENCEDLDAYICEMTLGVKKRYLGTGLAVMNMQIGGKYTVREMLNLALIGSYSDALYLAAITVFGDEGECIGKMKQKAAELGMKDTVFTDLNGLDDSQYSTAYDMALLFKAVYSNGALAEIIGTRSYTLSANSYREKATENYKDISFSNTCMILNPQSPQYYSSIVKAGKTGSMSAAGRCIATLANYEGGNYICVLLGEPTTNITDENGKTVRPDFHDTKNLYNWIINGFSYRVVVSKGDIISEIPVSLSSGNQYITLAAAESLFATLPNSSDNSTVEFKCSYKNAEQKAPIKAGEVLGFAEVYYGGKLIGNVDLVATSDVESSFFAVLGNAIKKVLTSTWFIAFSAALGGMILIFVTVIVVINIRRRLKRNKKVHKNNY